MPEPKKRGATGRPSLFTPALGLKICERLACGESLRTICKHGSMPAISTVLRWLADESDEAKRAFRDQYARAREAQAETLAEEILAIADTPLVGEKVKKDARGKVIEKTVGDMIEHRRLQVDARKWLAGKLAPKKYGDKLAVGGAEDLQPITVNIKQF